MKYMNEQSNNQTRLEQKTAMARSHRRRSFSVIIGAVALIGLAIAAWLLWPKQTGKPVPAPRSVSFGESSGPQTGSTGEQILTLAPEQLQRAGLKIETVGERPSTEAVGQMTTGVVQAN